MVEMKDLNKNIQKNDDENNIKKIFNSCFL